MSWIRRYVQERHRAPAPWHDSAPIREEIFGIERLEQHAASLAIAQVVTTRPASVRPLHARLDDNATVLLKVYRASALELARVREVVPAAEWLLDNYHLVEAQIRGIHDDLPDGYYRQLPKLANGPLAGYPRVLGLAWAFVAHTDSHFDRVALRRYIAAYQRVQPLTIGELWAVAITLRIVLIENLRRLAEQIFDGQEACREADALADRLLASGQARAALEADINTRHPGDLSIAFAAQIARRLRNQDPTTMPALQWLDERLALQDASINTAVDREQRSEGAANVSVRNIITSMRLISEIDWAEWFESVSLVDARLRASSAFAGMDFPTRDLYRSAIEELARGSSISELQVVERTLDVARTAATQPSDSTEAARVADPGYHLIAAGRRCLEQAIGFRPSLRRRLNRLIVRMGIGGYVGTLLLCTGALLLFAFWALSVTGSTAGLAPGWLTAFLILGFLPATEVATTLVNRVIGSWVEPSRLPALDLTAGIPQSARTLVAVPILLSNVSDLLEQIERLEVHQLTGVGGDISFALLSDWIDADQEMLAEDDALLDTAADAVDTLNRRYGPGPAGPRFILLHRRRLFNASENRWMGWERKRGKLRELNSLLRGADDTSFIPVAGRSIQVPDDVRYVIVLDADTRLTRDAAARLVGKMTHPLNRPRFSDVEQRVVEGYGILQPRVTPSLPVGHEGSFYQRVFSSPGGIDPYAAAVCDVYQDLFAEGSFTGKGIYEVDAFEASLRGRIPENTQLSHDLFEGIFARAGLVSDIEVIEQFPARYDVVAKRQQRWTRGDWQLLPWMLGHRPDGHAIPAIGYWKMLDNLRRSLLAPFTLLAFGLCLLLPGASGPSGLSLLLASIAIPAFLSALCAMLPQRTGTYKAHHVRMLVADLRLAMAQTLLTVTFAADNAWRTSEAIIRTLVRLFVTRHNLLEWTTAAQSTAIPRLGLLGFYRKMAAGTALGLTVTLGAILVEPSSWPLALPFAVLWAIAPALAVWTSRAPPLRAGLKVSQDVARELRHTARRTWRFFETFVTPAEHMLPPDNFQTDPKPIVARRTSPTNMGLYLLSAVAARDFGWAGTAQTLERLEATLATMAELRRFNGHFFNWYATADLRVLEPAYVSSVDSGNLAGHLLVLANACDEWIRAPIATAVLPGTLDTLRLAREALHATANGNSPEGHAIAASLELLEAGLLGRKSFAALSPVLDDLTTSTAGWPQALGTTHNEDGTDDLVYWIHALIETIGAHRRDQQQTGAGIESLVARLTELASVARALVRAMDFAFLLEPERKLLSIGYSLADDRLDSSCYDLLASEARLASLIAIAKGDVETRHWFHLGRAATPLGKGSALISWSGSMFEYLMPSLVMRAPIGSLLEQTNRLVVQRQQSYGRALSVPWGISESAYNARDLEFTYQYSNFGVPGLGLKRGLSENLVIAPYASGLAAMVDPCAAQANFTRLAALGASDRYGFYEAVDFTRARLPEEESYAVVRCYMAHHQGMIIVSIANALQDGHMRARFHHEPMIQATELLLQERMPREIAIVRPLAANVPTGSPVLSTTTVRRVTAPTGNERVTHLLSNGRYAVMLTATGAGYSRWKDIAVTRWHEDTTRDDSGSVVFLRDAHSGETWSASAHPTRGSTEAHHVVFAEDSAEFCHFDPTLATSMDVLVSGEDDGEVRRISLSNHGPEPREVELTSYAELVLTSPAADNAHPAFAKLFVETEYHRELGALIATRRCRTDDEPRVWAAHFATVEGQLLAEPQHETDRARFLGRGRTVRTARAIEDAQALSNTTGTVLDAIFSLRYRVLIPPGKVVRVAFWTLVAPARVELLDLIDKHHDTNAYDRAKTLAWTQAQVQLRHLDIDAAEAADFQRLTAPVLYSDRRFRSNKDALLRGIGKQSGLWPHAISGDLPIVLLRIDDSADLTLVRQLLRAQEYWHMKRLHIDLVIINERASSYTQDLQIAIETAVRSSRMSPRFGEISTHGSTFALRADLMSSEARNLIQAVARVVLTARNGSISDQLARVSRTVARPAAPARKEAPVTAQATGPTRAPPELEFFNGLGGFDQDGQEYVTILDDDASTPLPWLNVIANPGFGFQVSAEGCGYTWAANSRENQLTPWSNDPVTDPSGEAIYVRDEQSMELFGPTAQPVRDGGTFTARHGHGYSRFEHSSNGIVLDLLQIVPLADPIKISRLTLRNDSGVRRRLTVTAYCEWILGTSRAISAPFIITQVDSDTGALLAHNPWSTGFPGRIAFADLAGQQTDWTSDRTEFLGRDGDMAAPAALQHRSPLSGATGAGMDPCAVLQTLVEMAPNESIELVWLIGQSESIEEARALVVRYRQQDINRTLTEVTDHWGALLHSVQVKTPDRSMDIMLNGWLLYQTLACRLWARSAFYQASGAYGFRDQLQDCMALTLARPDETRRHLLLAASRQFVEGDVQHWWLPQSGQGVRTHISDDRVWLGFATATYITCSGDYAVLDEVVPFLDGPGLNTQEHDAFFQPMISDESASLFEHCARGIEQCITKTGAHGLPLIGTGDWNDGMNRVGEAGKGESVWLGWLLIRTIDLLAPLVMTRAPHRVAQWQRHAHAVREAIEREAWDGAWYRRATFDNGVWLGTSEADSCRIDSIAQSWAVLSRAADPAHARVAMQSLEQHLIQREDALALLFSPPFGAESPLDPGYIKAYPPGIRENGGQYTHAAMWAILAFAQLRETEKTASLFAMLNPINHARSPDEVDRYKVEPYAVAADVYSVPPHVGRGGWTWYTGSAGWMYRAGLEGVLGIRREGAIIVVDPCIPAAWSGFEATLIIESTNISIRVWNPYPSERGESSAVLDGVQLDTPAGGAGIPLDGGTHRLVLGVERA